MLLNLAKRIYVLKKFHSPHLVTKTVQMSRTADVPKLQVPKLDDSLKHFLTTIKQLINEKCYIEMVKATELFRINQGPYLQNRLVNLSRETENWASDVWVESRFLSNRTSLLLTSTLITLERQFEWRTMDEMLHSVSVLILHIMDTVEAIRNGNFPQEMIGDIPLCMRQYERITGVHRLPGINTDGRTHSRKGRHIVVLRNGKIFKMPVYGSGNNVVGLHEAFHLLREVVRLSGEPADVPVGLLTADNRDQWCLNRQELLKSPINSYSLKTIEDSLFGICLDDSSPPSALSASVECRFGAPPGGFRNFNRWFDLGFQAVFSRNGYCSWLIEHSNADTGIYMNVLAKLQDINSKIDHDSKKIGDFLELEQLKWDISAKIHSRVEDLTLQLTDWYSRYDTFGVGYKVYGNNILKQNYIYRFGFFHVAIQLAYFRLHKKFISTFFPVSLRRFSGGRLEHPHTVSRELVTFVEAMLENKISAKEKWELMMQAVLKFKDVLVESSEGKVYLKHILALKKLAEQEKMSVGLFENQNFDVFASPKLAFSTIFFPEAITSSYPTSEPNNFYVLFTFYPDSIFYSVTKMHTLSDSITSEEFSREIEYSLNSLYQLILTQSAFKSSL